MNHRDYVKLRKGKNFTLGKFGDRIYACEILNAFNIPEYHPVSKEEFDTFETWKDEQISDMKKLCEISKRNPICSAFIGCSDFCEEEFWGVAADS